MSAEQNYVVIDSAARIAGKVVVTPAAQPVRGKAEIELLPRGKMKSSPGVAVVTTTLEIQLPPMAKVSDVVHWTSYDA